MRKNNTQQSGSGVLLLIVAVVVLAVLGSGFLVYQHQHKTIKQGLSTKETASTITTDTKADPTAGWVKVESIGGAYSMRVPDGWQLTTYPGNTINGDNLTFSVGVPATIMTADNPYASDQKKFNVGFTDNAKGQDTAPQWESPNSYGTEAKTDFSIGSIKGTRYSIEYTQTVTGVTRGDKIYQYVFSQAEGKGLSVVYMQKAGDVDNLKTVEQAIRTIVLK